MRRPDPREENPLKRRRKQQGRRRTALGHTEPMRTCVACRQSAPPEGLLRFVRGLDGGVALDVRGRLDGRGAYTCARRPCVEKAREKGAFRHAFSAPVVFDDGFVDHVGAVLGAEIQRSVALHRRASRAVYGRDRVLAARETLRLVVLADDLADNTRRDVLEQLPGVPVHTGLTKSRLGHVFGRDQAGVVGVMDLGGATSRLSQDLRRFAQFGDSFREEHLAGRAPCDDEQEGVQAPKEGVAMH